MSKKNSVLASYRNESAYEAELLNYLTNGPKRIDSPAWWLKSAFWADHWHCDFGNNLHIDIDWDVNLKDGTSLLTQNNASYAFRTWLCVQSHDKATNGFREAPLTAYGKTGQVIRLIDLFILHYSHEELVLHGFAAISAGELSQSLIRLASASNTESSIYRWTETLANYLNSLVLELVSDREIEYYKKKYPLISVVGTADQDRMLVGFDDERVVLSRIALMCAGLYKDAKSKTVGDWYEPDNPRICEILYRETLNGWSHKTQIPELCFGDADIYLREMPSVYVRHGDNNETIIEKTLRVYARRFKTLGLLGPINAAPTQVALDGLEIQNIYKNLNLSAAGRFKSVPTTHLLFALERAITFYLENEDHLLDSFLFAAKAARTEGLSLSALAKKYDFNRFLTSQSSKMGIAVPSLTRTYRKQEEDDGYRTLFREEFYELLRDNHGLIEMVRVFFGSICVPLGLLSARRRSELCGLDADDCLDEDETSLKFDGAKSGLSGHRARLSRPIPPIVVRMIKRLRRFQDDLVAAGLIEKRGKLLALPTFAGGLTADAESAETAIDYFLDYIQMPCDSDGHRYYIRFHQARRFLPQMFMDSGIDGRVETLQWFLAHTDREQVWAYILEVSAGDAINQAAAQTATAQLRAGNSSFDALADYLYETFKVRDFWALTEDELAGYILTLEERRDVKVEMEFFTTPNGQKHRMLMKVIRRTK